MKKALKRSLSFLLAITIIFSSAYVGLSEVDFSGVFAVEAKAVSSGVYGDYGTWTLDDEGTLTIEGVTQIYGVYDEQPWYGLRNSIRDIVLKSGIKTIEGMLFYDAPNVISITIPDTVTNFDTMAIAGCTNLEEIIVDENNINYFSDNGVLYRRDLPYSTYTLLKYPSAKPGSEYEIYENTTFIGYYAFSDCGLISITIPGSVNKMNSGAFYNCLNLENVYITNLASWCSINYYDGFGTPFSYASNLYINGKLTTEIVIPDGLTSIKDYAFYGYDKLTSITIPNSVTNIGYEAFYDCTSLTDVYYIGTEEEWENVSFHSSNTNLTSAEIHFNPIQHSYGESVYDCSTATKTNECEICGHIKTEKFIVEDVLTFSLNDDGEAYTVSGCDAGIEGKLIIPATYNGLPVISIGQGAFANRGKNLTSIIIPDSVISIGNTAFVNCESLKSITIPDSVVNIGNSAFSNCQSLTSIVIGEGVTSIGSNAFNNCINVTTVVIGGSVTNIGSRAFRNCGSEDMYGEIPYVFYTGTEEDWHNITMDDVMQYGDTRYNNLLNSVIHFETTDHIYSGNIYNCSTATKSNECKICEYIETEGFIVEDILTFSFNDDGESYSIVQCNTEVEGLLIVPATYNGLPITSIGDLAFYECRSILSIDMPANVTSIAYNAFNGCSSNLIIKGDCDSFGITFAKNCGINSELVHTGTQGWIQTSAPTCIATGTNALICSSCGYIYETETINALGHDYDNGVITEKATCGADGVMTFTCTRIDCTASYTEVIPATGNHTYSTEWTIDVEPTQTSEGEKSRHCENCSERTDITPIPRLINDSVAYIETQGVLCNGEISYIVKLKAGDVLKGAIFGAVFDPEVLEPIDEKSGGYTITDSYGDEALNVNGMYVAGLKYGSEDTYVVGHINMSEINLENDTEYMKFTFKVKDFTAVEAAVDFYCVEFNGTPEIEHNDYEVTVSYCNNEIVSFDHTMSAEWKIEKEADAVEDGLQYKDCTVCGEVLETDVIPQTICEKPVITAVEQAEGGLVVTWDSVHGADYYDLYRKTTSNWEKIGQITSEYTAYTDVAVVNDTEYSYAIKAINEVGESQLSDIVCKVYHVHTMGDWLVRIEPTCTEYGESYRKCIGCEYEETELIEPTGHSYSTEWTVDVEPTCTEEGSKSHHCTACGDKADVTSIDSLGHDYDDGVVTKPATCEEDGVIAFTCTRKGCTASYTDVVPAIGHDYDTGRVILPATCEEAGTMRYSCQNEGCLSYYDEVITKLGHNMDNGAIIKEPTCIAEGEKVYKCLNTGCLHEVTEAIETVDHSYSDIWSIDVEATCTENGSKSHHCTVCGDKADITEIVATGHSYVLKGTLSAHPHTATYICSACDDEKSEANIQSGCIECNFTITPVDSTGYKLVLYIGSETDVTIPAEYNGRAITTIANACFRGNTSIKSVKIADGVVSIGSLAFMSCNALERVYIPSSVTSIGAQAFYGFTGTIYCVSGSAAHEYAVANNIAYVLVSITETENTEIDYDNLVIRTTVQNCGDITEILGVAQSAIAIPTASYIYGNIELFGTGTIITVFDGNEYIGDFTLVVEGDTNGDSVCDVLDAAQVATASSGKTLLTGAYALAADTNVDDSIDAIDYQTVVNKAVS